MKQVGMIGAGMMGSGIAATLQDAGYDVMVFKRSIDEQNEIIGYLRDHHVPITTDMKEVCSHSQLLLTCLPDSPTVENILLSEEGLAGVSHHNIKTVIDFTTAHPDSTKRVAEELLKQDIKLLDAPMTGGPAQARSGELGLAVGGQRDVYESFESLFSLIAKHYHYAGPQSSGNLLKLINNYLGIMNVCASSAAYALIEDTHVEKDAFYHFISASGGNSAGFQNALTRIRKNSFPMGFALGLAHKDLTYMSDFFSQVGGFQIFSATKDVMDQAMEDGFENRDLREVYFSIKDHFNVTK